MATETSAARKRRKPGRQRRKASLRARVILATCVVGVAINLFIAFVWVPRLQDILTTFAMQDARHQTEITGASLVPFLLSNELSGVYQTLDGVLEKQPGWHGLALVNAQGRQLYPLAPVSKAVPPGMARIAVDIHFNNRTIGALSADIDLRRQLARINHEGITLAMTLTALVTALLAGFLVLLEAWMTRPVRRMAEAALALRRGDFTAHLPESPLRDIDDLASSFDTMRRDLLTTQQGLEEAREAAEQTADVKTRILSTMSHEMRTPLNGMLGVAELLRSTQLTPEQQDYASTIHDLGSSLLWQIEDLLSAARFEANGIVPRYAPVNINEIAGTVVRGLEVLARGNGTDIRFEPLPEARATIRSDGAFLHHIVQNLLSNASKFTRNGTIVVALSAPPDAGRLSITVSDDGPGIAAEVIDRIFDDFVSISPDPAKLQKGTGLGLGIVRRMVEALGGEIHVDSAAGKGARFEVTLPHDPAESPGAPVKAASVDRMSPEELRAQLFRYAPMQPPRILVVEDNPTNMMILVRLFQSMGFETDEAEDGQAGYEKSRDTPYFLIVTDQQMPVLSGVEMARKIRDDIENENALTPIILVSANTYPDPEDRDQAFDASLMKPVSRETFIACAARIFGINAAAATGERAAPGQGAEVLFQPDLLAELTERSGPEAARDWLHRLDRAMAGIVAATAQGGDATRSADMAAQVHREISSALYLGFPRLAGALRNLEEQLRGGDPAGTAAAAALVGDVWQATRALDVFT